MKGNSWVIYATIALLFFIGFVFVFFSNKIREYYFEFYKQGIERTGFLTSWIDKYPNGWFFKFLGIIFIFFAIAITYIVFLKKSNM